MWPPYKTWNLNESDLLPTNWDREIIELISTKGFLTNLTGESGTSHEQVEEYKHPVTIVTGDAIKKCMPWLYSLYSGSFKDFSGNKFGKQLYCAKDLVSSININKLSGRGAVYEWHVDTNVITGVLYVTDHKKGNGGKLVFNCEGRITNLYPCKGLFVAFDGREIPHRVSPLLNDIDRISIPMNFYEDACIQPRDPSLNNYLYTSIEKGMENSHE